MALYGNGGWHAIFSHLGPSVKPSVIRWSNSCSTGCRCDTGRPTALCFVRHVRKRPCTAVCRPKRPQPAATWKRPITGTGISRENRDDKAPDTCVQAKEVAFSDPKLPSLACVPGLLRSYPSLHDCPARREKSIKWHLLKKKERKRIPQVCRVGTARIFFWSLESFVNSSSKPQQAGRRCSPHLLLLIGTCRSGTCQLGVYLISSHLHESMCV